ncbi:hypothetical protein IW261DRAFT_1420670 [Armillaria novae-zelandiae]|uniref:Uncharacterized protein n=1 Tax=Armillaria novae-zelandiae TaxID=153914 RepID=A0AA39P6H8_9AGAR|nr:hypothetical protein IW261DRAFT_1420670 [Armillaria novae-zelandiae]
MTSCVYESVFTSTGVIYFTVLSSLLAEHAHQIRSFDAEAHNWPELTCLCEELAFVEMPRLQKWIFVSNVNLVYEDEYDEGHPVGDISVLTYAFDSESEPVRTHELKRSGTRLYPALTEVILSGIRVAWSRFTFPALHNLKLRGLVEETGSSTIFIDMMKYLRLEQLEKLDPLKFSFPLADFPNRDLGQNGRVAEDSLPVLLQFIRRLVRVHDLGIAACSDALLKYMNYSKGGCINIAGVKRLWLHEDMRHPEVFIVPFLRE